MEPFLTVSLDTVRRMSKASVTMKCLIYASGQSQSAADARNDA